LITYPIDPLFGQHVTVWRRQTQRGVEAVIVDVPDGTRRVIPIEWTDLRPMRTCGRGACGLVLFDPWVILSVVGLVAENLTTAIAGSESRRFEVPPPSDANRDARADDRDARSDRARTSTTRGDRTMGGRARSTRSTSKRRR